MNYYRVLYYVAAFKFSLGVVFSSTHIKIVKKMTKIVSFYLNSRLKALQISNKAFVPNLCK